MHTMPALWQQQLAEAITSLTELATLTGLPYDDLAAAQPFQQDFPLRVPRPYAARIKKGDPQDPLLLQVLPQAGEIEITPGYAKDPLQEQYANKTPGLLHKYFGRVLLIPTQACAIHCRYCFRRHFPYQENRIDSAQMQAIIDYILQHPEVYEVILSGGDPLVLKDHTLAMWMTALSRLPQLRYVRIHTRLPIMLPARITGSFLQLLQSSRLQTTVVLHCNHAQEIDEEVSAAIQKMRDHRITVLNQSVLLRGVNDKAEALIDLSHALYTTGVLPYYLHLLDPIQGTAHFAVSEEKAKALMDTLRAQLPGFLVPRLVKEIAHADSKVPLC